ncbi:accessory gene regulator ArgB-like protein [Clostridium sp. ZS2-4]|uniref:accessory gene regulator ArgB-like protein n=1 Tax=Clostridium sp. ZS2-4 TaxID=2987703 RepID=UPI00227AFEC2|nr:accessory gene regulator B family protein [Clostridium sp. ZS2-4]MCY6355222.1 accessory gene regulator B family protein [Clostridium sp. ZS2-4]
MINTLSSKITGYIEKNSNIHDTDNLAKINYALQAVLGETFKIVILISLFLIIGRINYLLFSMAILFTTRIFLGGYHCNTTMSCLFASIIMFLITSLVGPLLPKLNILIYYLAAILSVLIVIFNAPFPNKYRPIKNQKRKQTLKYLSTFFTISWSIILLFYVKDTAYLNCGFLTIILEIIQVIPTRKENNYEK